MVDAVAARGPAITIHRYLALKMLCPNGDDADTATG